MSFMPAFNQSVMMISRERQLASEAELLALRSREGLSHHLGRAEAAMPAALYLKRLEDELRVIEGGHFCGYFLIVADYVSWAKDNGIPVGPGRGSGPCSLVAFVLGITRVDPIEYNLPFERFINPLRDVLPDFDLDFCDKRCGEVTDYIRTTYGADRVARLSDEDQSPLDARLVIADRPLAELVPIDTDFESGIATAKMTMDQIDVVGLVRFNVINQNALTINQQSVWELAKSGEMVDVDDIPLDDKRVYRLLSAGESSNLSLLDGADYRATLMAVQPDKFSDLYAVVALCYPRLQSIAPQFIKHKRNPETVSCVHPVLEGITAETYGLILYQEQVMHIVHAIAEFPYAEGDLFRRALQKEHVEALDHYKKKFFTGAIKFGLNLEEASSLFDQLAEAGRNGFNKSHAVAFAMMAYQTAWLKCRLVGK